VYLYSIFIVVPHTQSAQVWITQFYLQITPYLPLPWCTRWCFPRLRLQTSNCSLLLIYLPPNGWKAELAWLAAYSGWFTHVTGKSSARQGKFAGQRPTFYHCMTQPTNQFMFDQQHSDYLKSPATQLTEISTSSIVSHSSSASRIIAGAQLQRDTHNTNTCNCFTSPHSQLILCSLSATSQSSRHAPVCFMQLFHFSTLTTDFMQLICHVSKLSACTSLFHATVSLLHTHNW